jgi:hypothetical protein
LVRSPLLEPPFGGQIRLAPNLIQLRRIAARFAPLQVIDPRLAESRDLVLHLGDRSPELGDLAAEKARTGTRNSGTSLACVTRNPCFRM